MRDEVLSAKVRAYLDSPDGWLATGAPGLRRILDASDAAARNARIISDPYAVRPHGTLRVYRRRSVIVTPNDPAYTPPRGLFGIAENHATLFEDMETGIVVANPSRYEQWLKKLAAQEGAA